MCLKSSPCSSVNLLRSFWIPWRSTTSLKEGKRGEERVGGKEVRTEGGMREEEEGT